MTIESILPTPDIFSAKRILCVQPHYDDNDIAAAGILARLQQNGAEIFYLTVTDDLMGVVDSSLSNKEALKILKRDQFAAGKIIGVKEQYWLGYPDAGEYDYFAVRRDLLKYIRMIQPDFVFTADPWLTYEGHRDHIQTGLATSEAVMFAGLTKIASSDPTVDAAYEGHDIQGIAQEEKENLTGTRISLTGSILDVEFDKEMENIEKIFELFDKESDIRFNIFQSKNHMNLFIENLSELKRSLVTTPKLFPPAK